jgi:hypothetical protein
MLNVEYIEMSSKDTKNLWFISSLNKWRNYKSNPSGFDESMPTREEVRRRIHNKYLKIICPEGHYIKVPKIKGEKIQYLSSSDDNYANKDFNVYFNKPNELFIKVDESIIDMKDDALLKKYLVHVISDTNDKIEKYGIILTLEYKNNGLIGNPDFKIVTSVAVHKFDEKNIFYNTIDVTFLALMIYQISIWIYQQKVDLSGFGYIEVAILISYFSQLLFRTKYVGSTIINKTKEFIKFLWLKIFTKKNVQYRKNYFTEKEFMKEIYKNSR